MTDCSTIWPPSFFNLPGEEIDYDLIDEDPTDDEGALPDPNEDPPKCKDCGGTGWYIGFTSKELCDTCGGSGY